MTMHTQLLLGSLGLLALLGCSSSDSSHSSGYLVNAIAVADIDANGLPDILGVVSTEFDGASTQGYVSTRLQSSAGAFVMPTRFGVGRSPANLVAQDGVTNWLEGVMLVGVYTVFGLALFWWSVPF